MAFDCCLTIQRTEKLALLLLFLFFWGESQNLKSKNQSEKAAQPATTKKKNGIKYRQFENRIKHKLIDYCCWEHFVTFFFSICFAFEIRLGMF